MTRHCVLRDKQGSRSHGHHGNSARLQDLIHGRRARPLRASAKPEVEPEDKAVNRPASNVATPPHVGADDGQALAEPATNPTHREAHLLGDLAVCQATEVSQLDDLLVLGGQLVDGFIDRLAGHGAGKVLPWLWALAAIVDALDEDLLELGLRTSGAPAIDRRSSCSAREPAAPGVGGCRRDDRLSLVRDRTLLPLPDVLRTMQRAKPSTPHRLYPNSETSESLTIPVSCKEV